MREGHTQRLELRFEDPFSVWPTLLDYFYTGHLEINESNAMGLLNLAKGLMVAAVEEAARWAGRRAGARAEGWMGWADGSLGASVQGPGVGAGLKLRRL